jgi:hypothetical protein
MLSPIQHRLDHPTDGSASTTLVRRRAGALDALPLTCGLFPPTFTERWIGIMSHHKGLDVVTGNCGVSLPTLLTRIGSMAAHGRPDFTPRACRAIGASSLSNLRRPYAGPEVQARPPVKTTATSIASGPADTPAAAIRMKVAKRFSGPSPSQCTALQTGPSSRHGPQDDTDAHRVRTCSSALHRGAGSTTGYGWASPSRPAGRLKDRRLAVRIPVTTCFGNNP